MPGRKHLMYLAMMLAALAACGANDQAGKSNGSKLSNSEMLKRLAEIAGQSNQAAPAEVDTYTRLDGAKAGPGLRLTVTYTLIDPEAEGVDGTNFGTKLTPVVREGSCKNTDLRPLIDQGALVVLEYNGNDGKPIGTVNIDRKTCAAIR